MKTQYDINEVSLEALGVTLTEMHSYLTALKTGIGNPDRYICICGHQMARHEVSGGISSCVVSRSWCACNEPIAVLDPEQVNPFRFTTTGFGKKHALTKGIYALMQIGKKADWIIEISCFRCKKKDHPIMPTPLNHNLKITYSSGSKNVLLCEECIFELDHIFV